MGVFRMTKGVFWLAKGVQEDSGEQFYSFAHPIRTHKREIQTHCILSASIRMEKLASNIGNSCIKSPVIELHRIKTLRHCQEQEESTFRMRPGHTLRHMFFEQRDIGDCYSSIASSMVQDVYFKVGNELTSLVKAESQSLRAQGADVIIYVLHDDYNNYGAYDTSLSNGYVDLVFEGHSHQRVRAQDEYGVWHLQAGGDNYDGISRARVYVNTETNEVSVSTEIVSLYSYQSMQDDPIVEELLEKYESSLTKVNEVVGYNKSYRDYDDLGALAAEATYHAGMKRWENSQYADKIVLGGGFLKARSPYYLPTKNVTYGDLYCLFPFDNDLVLCSISGSRLKRQFLQTTNDAYHMYYSDYGKSLDPNSLSLTDTYYVIVDTYTSDYSFSGMGPMQIVEYYSQTEEYYNRDALADFAKAGGLNGGYNPNPSEKPDDSDTPITPLPLLTPTFAIL